MLGLLPEMDLIAFDRVFVVCELKNHSAKTYVDY